MFVCRSCLQHRGYATLHNAARKAVGIPVIERSPRPTLGSDLQSSTRATTRPGANADDGRSDTTQYVGRTTGTIGSLPIDISPRPREPIPSPRQPPGRAKRELVDPKVHRAMKKELEWLKNEYNIGQHVQASLAKNKFVQALHLVREASKSMQLTVSWNHLIEYEMQRQHLGAAVKLFNEMKKRAQLPNAQTYTIIFKGCAQQKHSKQAVAEATRIFTSMINRERIEPNTIHLNAVLDACAKAEDLESLLNVAQAAGGKLQLDHQSYTTILNCLRATTKIWKTVGKSVSEESAAEAQVTIARAKILWEEIVAKWRKSRIIMDEDLVCAMGRILLLGTAQDCSDVLALVHQTMGIDPTVDVDTTSLPEADASVAAVSPETTADVSTTTSENRDLSLDTAANMAAASGSPVLAPFVHNPSPQFMALKTSEQYLARPGPNVLSLLLTACYETSRPDYALKYWQYLTKTDLVIPDSDNFYRVIQALHRGKNSASTVEIMKTMPEEWLQPKTFRLAMATCLHNHRHQKAFADATEILVLADRTLKKPDHVVLDKYLVTAMECNLHFRKMMKEGRRDLAKREFGKQLIFAMDRLWEQMRRIWAFDSYPDVDVKGCAREWDAMKYPRLDFAALQRRLLAVYSKLFEEELIFDQPTWRLLAKRRDTLNKRLTQFFEERKFRGAKINEMHETLSEQRGVLQKATHRPIASGVDKRRQAQKAFSWLKEEE